jgi:hypothetical protein
LDCLVIEVKIGIIFFCTVLTDTMAELRVRVFFKIGFYLIPVPLVIAYFLAMLTDGYQP